MKKKKELIRTAIIIILGAISIYLRIHQPYLLHNFINDIQNISIEQITFKADDRGKSIGNTLNGSFIAKSGEDYFFNKNPFSIYKADANFAEETSLFKRDTGWTARDINVLENWIFFARNGIYRMTTEGENLSKLYIGITSNVQLKGDWIYFVLNDGKDRLYRIDVNGKNKEVVYNNSVLQYITREDLLFVLEGYPRSKSDLPEDTLRYRLLIIDLNTNNNLLEHLEINTHQFVIDSEWVYYINRDDNNKLYRLTHHGEEITKLTNESVKKVNINNEWLYFINSTDDNTLYRIKNDGSELEKISNTSFSQINIIDDMIYGISERDQRNKNLIRIRANGEEEIISILPTS